MADPVVGGTVEAGREMDIRIAVEVMGMTGIRSVSVLDRNGYHSEPGTVTDCTLPDGRFGRRATRLPRYSTDIAAAMTVLEKMRADGFVWDMGTDGESDWSVDAIASHKVSRRSIPSANAVAPTLPLAICRAALAALAALSPVLARASEQESHE